MSAHVLCKTSQQGIGLATVELTDVSHVFATATPQCDGTFREQAENAVRSLGDLLSAEQSRQAIIRQRIFLSDPSQIAECRQIIHNFYGSDLPATSYIPQPLCDGKLLSIEVHGVKAGKCGAEIQRVSEELVVLQHGGMSWAFCAPAVPHGSTVGTYEMTALTLQRIGRLLNEQEFRFDQVLRTWFYLGGIVSPEGATQRYKELNRAGPISIKTSLS